MVEVACFDPEGSADSVLPAGKIQVGRSQLPWYVELAVKSMRVGEECRVTFDERFLQPAPPPESVKWKKKNASSRFMPNVEGPAGEITYTRKVVLSHLSTRFVLTEDRGVVKAIEKAGTGLRKPMQLDWVSGIWREFAPDCDDTDASWSGLGELSDGWANQRDSSGAVSCKGLLDPNWGPHPGLYLVVTSMKFQERCAVTLSGRHVSETYRKAGRTTVRGTFELLQWRRPECILIPNYAGGYEIEMNTDSRNDRRSEPMLEKGCAVAVFVKFKIPEEYPHRDELPIPSEGIVIRFTIGAGQVPVFLDHCALSMRMGHQASMTFPPICLTTGSPLRTACIDTELTDWAWKQMEEQSLNLGLVEPSQMPEHAHPAMKNRVLSNNSTGKGNLIGNGMKIRPPESSVTNPNSDSSHLPKSEVHETEKENVKEPNEITPKLSSKAEDDHPVDESKLTAVVLTPTPRANGTTGAAAAVERPSTNGTAESAGKKKSGSGSRKISLRKISGT